MQMVGRSAKLLIFPTEGSSLTQRQSRKFFVMERFWVKNLDVTYR